MRAPRGGIDVEVADVMRKILIAVDGSAAAIHAARKGLELARVFNASVTLAYVQPLTLVYGSGALGLSQQVDDMERGQGEQVLRQTLAELEPLLPIPTTKLLRGVPAEALADAALNEGFELVVVGNTGRGAVSRVLLGSVADRLVHICKQPVLVVR